jgi:hypothetical protein
MSKNRAGRSGSIPLVRLARELCLGLAARFAALCAAALAVAALTAAPALAAPNQPPQIILPAPQSTPVNTPITFAAANSNALSVTDPDAGGDDLEVTMVVQNGGTITLGTTAGLIILDGDGDGTVVFQGSITETIAAWEGMTYTPQGGFENAAGITVTVNDLGHNGDDGFKTDTKTVLIGVGPNGAPTNQFTPGLGTFRNQSLVLSTADSNNISILDGDAGSGPVAGTIEVGLGVNHGTLTLGGTTGIGFQSGANGSAAMVFRGTRANIDTALNGLTFAPPTGFTGDVDLAVNTNDLGSSGTGGAQSDNDVISISVAAPQDMIFWTASKETGVAPAAIGRAELDGGGGANLVTGPELNDTPAGVAIDAVEGRIYWAITPTFNSTPSIYSANLDGSDKQIFLTSATVPAGAKLNIANGLAIDQGTRRLYWANNDNVTAANKGIFYASLDNPSVGGAVNMAGVPTVGNPRGLALDLEGGRAFWTSVPAGTNAISFAPLPGSAAAPGTFTHTMGSATPISATGVALDLEGDRLFWTNSSGDTAATRLKVAPYDGSSTTLTGAAFDISPNLGGSLRTPAIDPTADRIYWGNSSADKISYGNLDGSGGGTDLPIGDAIANSLDGVAILRHPEPVSPPMIGGTPSIGSTMTCTAGIWAPDQPNAALYRSGSTSYQWTLNGAAISGANGSAYIPTQGGTYGCTQTTTNFAGASTQSGGTLTVPAAPATQTSPVTDDPCDALRKKLKAAKSKKKRKKLKKKLRKNGC